MEGKSLEWIIAKPESISEKIIRMVSLVALIFSGVSAIITFGIPFFILTIAFGAAYIYLWMNQFVEYEFCYVLGELEIAKVYNHRRRKKKFTCKLEEIEYICKGIKKENGNQSLSFYLKENVMSAYTMLVNQEGKRTNIFMEVDEAFLKELQKVWKVK